MAQPARTAPSSAHGRPEVRLLRRRPEPAAVRLPHPSWRRALGGVPEVADQRLASASEFWDRLGI